MRNIDFRRSPTQILEEIRVAATDPDPAHLTVAFAVLLVRLSEQANATTRKLVRLTWVLFWLIVLLLLLVLPPIVTPWVVEASAAVSDVMVSLYDEGWELSTRLSTFLSHHVSEWQQ
jgi:hypothetical protein